MALPRKNIECHEHDLAIQKLEGRQEALERHHNFYKEKFGSIELTLEELKYFSINTNNAIKNLEDVPARLRKQEDKAVVFDLIKVGIGIILGLMITNYVGQTFITTREEKVKQTESNK
jgi:hypothetical protein